jgi:hypothetical protein
MPFSSIISYPIHNNFSKKLTILSFNKHINFIDTLKDTKDTLKKNTTGKDSIKKKDIEKDTLRKKRGEITDINGRFRYNSSITTIATKSLLFGFTTRINNTITNSTSIGPFLEYRWRFSEIFWIGGKINLLYTTSWDNPKGSNIPQFWSVPSDLKKYDWYYLCQKTGVHPQLIVGSLIKLPPLGKKWRVNYYVSVGLLYQWLISTEQQNLYRPYDNWEEAGTSAGTYTVGAGVKVNRFLTRRWSAFADISIMYFGDDVNSGRSKANGAKKPMTSGGEITIGVSYSLNNFGLFDFGSRGKLSKEAIQVAKEIAAQKKTQDSLVRVNVAKAKAEKMAQEAAIEAARIKAETQKMDSIALVAKTAQGTIELLQNVLLHDRILNDKDFHDEGEKTVAELTNYINNPSSYSEEQKAELLNKLRAIKTFILKEGKLSIEEYENISKNIKELDKLSPSQQYSFMYVFAIDIICEKIK